jgi:HNH/ENDO VII superfamily nuclease
VLVSDLKLGMHLLRADGRVSVVTGWQVVPGTKVMYNLEVAQDHTFVVGAGQWVVHNCNRPLLRSRLGAGPREQAHHIIPCQCENNPVVRVAQALGFDIDSTTNGKILSMDLAVAAARGEPYHLGPHPVYTDYINNRLNYWDNVAPNALVL